MSVFGRRRFSKHLGAAAVLMRTTYACQTSYIFCIKFYLRGGRIAWKFVNSDCRMSSLHGGVKKIQENQTREY